MNIFSFAKRKSSITGLSSKSLVTCLGPNYKSVVYNDQGECFDDNKEELFARIKSKLFVSKDIEALDLTSDFDVWQGMIWLPLEKYLAPDNETYETPAYRLTDFSKGLLEHEVQILLEYINFESFYSTDEILTVAGILEKNLMVMCEWEKYTKHTLFVKKDNQEVIYYLKTNLVNQN